MQDRSPSQNDPRPQDTADIAAAKVVDDTFRLLGIDLNDIVDLNNLRDDFRYVRRQRMLVEARRAETSKSVIAAAAGAVVGMLVSGATWLIAILRHQQ